MQNPLGIYLEAADGASNVLAHAKLLIKLSKLYQEVAPPHLRQASSLANYKSGIIVIHATNGAVATKLRQLAPTLADGFRQRGVECSDVQVKAQATGTPTQSRSSTPKPLSVPSSRALEDLRDALPDSSLRQAVETLLQRSAREE